MTAAESGEDLASTPSLVGYLAAVWISWLLISLGSGVLMVLEPDVPDAPLTAGELLEIPGIMLEWAILVGAFAMPTAPVGVLVVHLACERFDAQWIHVLASGLVGTGAVVTVSVLLLGGPFEFWELALGVGLCTALGRAAVIPMVPVIRAGYAQGTPYWQRRKLRGAV